MQKEKRKERKKEMREKKNERKKERANRSRNCRTTFIGLIMSLTQYNGSRQYAVRGLD